MCIFFNFLKQILFWWWGTPKAASPKIKLFSCSLTMIILVPCSNKELKGRWIDTITINCVTNQ